MAQKVAFTGEAALGFCTVPSPALRQTCGVGTSHLVSTGAAASTGKNGPAAPACSFAVAAQFRLA